jgi:hypothetical protein
VVTDTYVYDAFGNTVTQTGSTVNAYRYRGEQFGRLTDTIFFYSKGADVTWNHTYRPYEHGLRGARLSACGIRRKTLSA